MPSTHMKLDYYAVVMLYNFLHQYIYIYIYIFLRRIIGICSSYKVSSGDFELSIKNMF